MTQQDGEKADGEEMSAEEQRVLQRKLKKLRKKEEKAKLREEGNTATKVLPDKSIPAQQALAYLTWYFPPRLPPGETLPTDTDGRGFGRLIAMCNTCLE